MSKFETDRRTALVFAGGALTGGYLTSLYELTTRPSPQSPSNSSTDSTDTSSESIPLRLSDRPIMGNETAEVTIVYYSDYQCPFCARFEQETLPELKSEYLASESNVRLIFKPVSVFGEDSLRAARASHCVWEQVGGDQTIFWEWHNRVTDSYTGERNSGWASVDKLVSLADGFDGVDSNALRECLESGEYEIDVLDDSQEGRNNDMKGTPFFLVFGQNFDEARSISGAQPASRFKPVINDYL